MQPLENENLSIWDFSISPNDYLMLKKFKSLNFNSKICPFNYEKQAKPGLDKSMSFNLNRSVSYSMDFAV